MVLFQILYRAFPHFTFLKNKTKSTYYYRKYLQFTTNSSEPSNEELHNSIISKFSRSLLLYIWPHQGFTSFQKRAAFTRLTSGYFLIHWKGWDHAKKSPRNPWSPRPYIKQFCMFIQFKVIKWRLTLVHQKPTYATIIYLLNEVLASGQRISGLCLV